MISISSNNFPGLQLELVPDNVKYIQEHLAIVNLLDFLFGFENLIVRLYFQITFLVCQDLYLDLER